MGILGKKNILSDEGKEIEEQGNVGAVKAKMGCVEKKVMGWRETRDLLSKKKVILNLKSKKG